MNVKLEVNYLNMKKNLFLIILLFLIQFNSQAQVPDTIKTDPSLRGQYQAILSKSKTLNGYKLVNPTRLTSFWSSVRDSLGTLQKQLSTITNKMKEQDREIDTLKKDISGTTSSLASSNARINEINFLGISFTKTNYNTLVWGLIIGLALALTFIILKSAKHIHEAKYRSTLYEEIAQEYQAYKVKANEKEKKLARELQDERNKLEEIRMRGK